MFWEGPESLYLFMWASEDRHLPKWASKGWGTLPDVSRSLDIGNMQVLSFQN